MLRILVVIVVAALQAGCLPGGATSAPGVRPDTSREGEPVVIVSFRPVRIAQESDTLAVAGGAAGAVAGGLAAEKLMSGGLKVGGLNFKKETFGVAGAVVGAMEGARYAAGLGSVEGIEIVARRGNGQQVVVVQENGDGWKPWIGQQARLVTEGDSARIAR